MDDATSEGGQAASR
jgi:hypothetical protein